MKSTLTRAVSGLMLVVLAGTIMPLHAAPDGARLEGYLLDVDGQAARGYRVHLIDADGRDVAQSATSDEGVYRFRELEAGSYALGIENREGQIAPVSAAPVRIAPRGLARRDIKLVEASAERREAVGVENHSFGTYWAGLTPAAKAWSVVGIFVILGVTIQALDDDDAAATPTVP